MWRQRETQMILGLGVGMWEEGDVDKRGNGKGLQLMTNT